MTPSTDSPAPRAHGRRYAQRLLFACGQLGLMASVRFFFSWNLKFADQQTADGALLFDAAMVGLAFFAFRIFDGVTDPIAGWVSDRWARAGRERRVLLWFFFAVPSIGLVLIFAPTHEMAAGLRWALMLSGMFLFFVGYTFYGIPYWSLTDDYTADDTRERRILSTLLGAGLLLATGVIAVASPLVIDTSGYGTAAFLFAVPCALLMMLPYFGKQRPLAPVEKGSSPPPLLRQILAAFRHRRFVGLLLVFSGSQMAFTVITAAAPFIATTLLGETDKAVANLMGPFLLTAIPCFAFAPVLSRRLGWERVMVVASIALAIVYAGAAGLGYNLIHSPLVTAMILFSFAGPMAAALLGLEAEAITDCAREAGGEVTSLYWGVFNFFVKGLNGAAMLFTGLLVGASHEPGWEVTAVRAMPFLAGALLVIGVTGYFLARRKRTEVVQATGSASEKVVPE